MSAKRRLPRALALALIAGGVLAPAASAGSIEARSEIYGAGSIKGLPWMTQIIPCEQAEPAGDATHKACTPWTLDGGDNSLTTTIYAEPRGGWQFAGWEGCDTVVGTACTLSVSSGAGTKVWRPKARFVDIFHPGPIPDLAVAPAGDEQGLYEGTWSDTESHLRYRCAIDAEPAFDCASGAQFRLGEGHHTISVHAVDPNGNEGVASSASVTVVDTALVSGPAEGATVRAAAFSARSGFGTDFECALDGAPFTPCGSATPGSNAPLTLPALADGRHTLKVRARAGSAYDRSPVTRSWTIDTTPVTPAPTPTPVPTPPRTPSPAPVKAATPQVAATSAPPAISAPHTATPARLRLSYRYRAGRFTRLSATGVPAGTKLKIAVKCPKGTRCIKRPKTLAKLVGKRLAPGTRITVRAGAQQVTLRLRRGRGPIQTAAPGR